MAFGVQLEYVLGNHELLVFLFPVREDDFVRGEQNGAPDHLEERQQQFTKRKPTRLLLANAKCEMHK